MRARYVLNETYESYIDLKKISNTIFDNYSKGIIKLNKIHDIKDEVNPENYPKIKDFISSGIGIVFSTYEYFGEGLYNTEKECLDTYNNIILEFGENNQELKNKFKGFIVIFNNHTIDEDGKLFFRKDIILHELQHAYDDFRSYGKFGKSKKSLKYLKKLENNPTNFNIESYIRTSEELSSFFVQTIYKINFFNKNNLIKSFNIIYKEFIKKFKFWNYLTPKIKRNLIRKLSQYYYKIKEEQNEI